MVLGLGKAEGNRTFGHGESLRRSEKALVFYTSKALSQNFSDYLRANGFGFGGKQRETEPLATEKV